MIQRPEHILDRPSTCGNGQIPISLGPCLKYYSIICHEKHLKHFLLPIICKYVHHVKTPISCELCQRSRFALTAHHLIPRSVRGIALQHKWHNKKYINSIAWLCRGCHEHVHRIFTPQALGRHYSSIELLLRRTEIWQFAKTVGRLVNK